MNDHFHDLNDAYKSLLAKESPRKSSNALASCMFTCVSELTPDYFLSQQQNKSRETFTFSEFSQNPNPTEMACLVLTLVDKISTTLTCQELSQESLLYFKHLFTVLFQDMDFMSKLVKLLSCNDRLLSHLAAKSISSNIISELHCSSTVNRNWERKCLQGLQNPCSANELDACMWSITTVLKAVLKKTAVYNQGILEKLLATFDPAVTAVYSQLLPEQRGGHGQDWATTLSTFLDMLEVLTAARFKLSATSDCFTSLRLSFVQASALLQLVHSPVNYFVKKQVLLLLKRILLKKAGEDMALGETSSLMRTDDHMTIDLGLLAEDVLQAVHADWLRCVPVGLKAVSFGGTSQLNGGSSNDSDYVMLRAVSLVVLKAVEYKVQCAGGKGDATDIHGYLSALLLFLNQHGVHLGSHSCCWVSLVFGEQDDDMMEAAKALLDMHQRLSSGQDTVAPCFVGGNPHCHFLFLLHNIAFDHSILLDFLISTETCFLEYFVRYLKLLRDDWGGFFTVSQKIDLSDQCELSSRISQKDDQLMDSLKEGLQQSLSVSCGSVSTPSHPGESVSTFDPEPAHWLQPSPCLHSGGTTALSCPPPLRLVDYGSSESDTEIDDSEGGLDPRKRETELRRNALPKSSESKGTCGGVGQLMETPTGSFGYVSTRQSRQMTCPGDSTHNTLLGQSWSRLNSTMQTQRALPSGPIQVGLNSNSFIESQSGVTFTRTVGCLAELREQLRPGEDTPYLVSLIQVGRYRRSSCQVRGYLK
ncbi:hypothetical protein UPYG_G00087380 [Umbra pygmaea]|uniref:Protein Lines N-terminal domain-containing protein n=1 Tax=Umbra pygmaea TaxID=75934 RepID=A0ABD0Y4B8_UMBPY